MKNFHVVARAASALVCAIFILAASAAERPAKLNKDFNPAAANANGFSVVTTGVIVKLTTASIAKDGTITARFTITDSQGAGLDVAGVQTPGTLAMALVAAYIPKGKTQYTAYTTTVTKAT